MNQNEVLAYGRELMKTVRTPGCASGALSAARELVKQYAGEKSPFYTDLLSVDILLSEDYIQQYIISILASFCNLVEKGFYHEASIKRKTQIDVVSDFLSQAQSLLDGNSVHAAAPAVIIGAALEEFLRNWVEESSLTIDGSKPSIDSYAKALLNKGLITKQDMKDITSWAGIRNDAAHGHWDKVTDKSYISLMFQGVNLFMRKYGPYSDEN